MAMSPGFGLKLLVEPTWEPVVPEDMVTHSRINSSDVDNGVLAGFLLAAREYVETACKRAIATQQWQITLDQFPGRQVDDYRPPTWRYGILRVPMPPLQSVDLVEYVDPGQATQPFVYTTLASSQWMVDTNTEPGRLAPAPFFVWPATNPLAFQAVRIKFTAGYASADLVPQRIKQAIKLLAAHYYENREEVLERGPQETARRIPFGIRALILSCSAREYR